MCLVTVLKAARGGKYTSEKDFEGAIIRPLKTMLTQADMALTAQEGKTKAALQAATPKTKGSAKAAPKVIATEGMKLRPLLENMYGEAMSDSMSRWLPPPEWKLCAIQQLSVSAIRKYGSSTSLHVSDDCSADIGIVVKDATSPKGSPKYELALAVMELKYGQSIFDADVPHPLLTKNFCQDNVDKYHLGPVMQSIAYVMSMVLPSLRSRGYSGPLYTAVINARKGEAVENDTGVFALALRLDPSKVCFDQWTVVIERFVRYSDTNACHLVTDIVLNTLAQSLQTYVTRRDPTVPLAPLFGPLDGTQLVLSPCPQLSDNGDTIPSTIHYGELLVVVDAARCTTALQSLCPVSSLLLGTYDVIEKGHLIKLVGAKHIVPSRDLTGPSNFGRALDRLASALREQQTGSTACGTGSMQLVEQDQQLVEKDQQLVEQDQQHAQQLEREKLTSVQRELDLWKRLEALMLSSGGNPSLDDMFNLFAESKTESSTAQTGAKSWLPAAPRPVDPLESSPVQPVTPPARSGLDILHEKIGEVLVCAGMARSGSFMVMKNVDSGGYVRVTLEDVQQWRTFFKHVVTNFLLPLADLNLVHDDLRPDCANLRCRRDDQKAVMNVVALDLDSLRPFATDMFNGADGRYPMSETCLTVYSFVAAQTLLIAFCAAETVTWQDILSSESSESNPTLAERGMFLMNHSVLWAPLTAPLTRAMTKTEVKLYVAFDAWIAGQSTGGRGLKDMVKRIRGSECVTPIDVESLASLSLSSQAA